MPTLGMLKERPGSKRLRQMNHVSNLDEDGRPLPAPIS
jgi:hypothetical protein